MSAARWCDYGQHAFAADREGTIVMGQVVKNNSGRDAYGNQTNVTQEVREMCPECAAEVGIVTDYKAPPAPLTRQTEFLKELADGQPTGKHAK